ncbi:prepilin-type N-terminal cleavage/methylation domain-containing protein [Chloroflexota bacterium]
MRFSFVRGQKGFTLIETLVGLVIFTAVGVALMNGLFTGYKSLDVSQERVYAEGLAKSQVEYIKAQDYISVANYPYDGPYDTMAIPAHLAAAGYSVEVDTPVQVDVPGASGYELQGISVNVNYQGATKLTITFYRTGLAL